MKMRQIKYFLALCDERSFTRAAKSCGVSQPSFTNGIKAFENELGGHLFTRRPNIVPTRLGASVRPHLMRILQDAETVAEMARSMHNRSAETEDVSSHERRNHSAAFEPVNRLSKSMSN